MDAPANDVWVFVEQRGGRPHAVSFELLSKGRKLAEQLGGTLKAVLLGHGVREAARELFRFGAREVLLVDHAALADYRTMPYARIVGELVGARQPRIVLFGATVVGRDLAPRVASQTRSGLTADCTDLQIGDVSYLRKEYKNLLLQIRPALGGNIIATIITPDVPVQMATVREGVMEASAAEGAVEGRVVELPYVAAPADELVQVVERHQEESPSNLKHAPIVVAGGYGMGTRENFGLLHKLAELLGGDVAATRAAVDAGFATSDRQVGQTGLTVRPKLYIACGISGAIQHRAGMEKSGRIVAINTDPAAPIFDICHHAIVGDVATVIPTFIEAYRERLR